jgi:hypothetical protein
MQKTYESIAKSRNITKSFDQQLVIKFIDQKFIEDVDRLPQNSLNISYERKKWINFVLKLNKFSKLS